MALTGVIVEAGALVVLPQQPAFAMGWAIAAVGVGAGVTIETGFAGVPGTVSS